MASLIDDMADHSSASEGEEHDEPTPEDDDFINDGDLDFDFDGEEEVPKKRLKKGKKRALEEEDSEAPKETAKLGEKGKAKLVDEGKGKSNEDVEEATDEPQDGEDNASLFKKRKLEAKETKAKAKQVIAPKKVPGGKYAGYMFAMQISDVNSFRQIVSILCQVQTRCSVDGVMFHITQEDAFSGLEFTLSLDSVLLTGRLACLPLHVWEDDSACFYVNVGDLSTQLKHIKHDNVCVITKKAGDSQLVINSYAQGPDTSSVQVMKLNEPELLDEHPGYFPPMKYDFDLVLSAPDMKTLVQQASEISATAMEITLFKASGSNPADISSVFQFEATEEARCKSVQQRFVNYAEKSVDSDGVYHLDTLIADMMANGTLKEKVRHSYTVETLKFITMSLKNEHQITLSFGAPSIVDGDTREVIPWDQYITELKEDPDNDTSAVDFMADALFLNINLNEDSYIKMLVSARVDVP